MVCCSVYGDWLLKKDRNLELVLVVFVGGYIANSLAIMTDAAHMFTDVMNFGISLLAIWLGKKQSSNSMTFGWQRAGHYLLYQLVVSQVTCPTI